MHDINNIMRQIVAYNRAAKALKRKELISMVLEPETLEAMSPLFSKNPSDEDTRDFAAHVTFVLTFNPDAGTAPAQGELRGSRLGRVSVGLEGKVSETDDETERTVNKLRGMLDAIKDSAKGELEQMEKRRRFLQDLASL